MGSSPVYYSRTGGMYELMTPTYNSQKIDWEYDPSVMNSSNGTLSSNELYEMVFKQGWHGGAPSGPDHPSPGTPYWRTPYPYYSHWSQPAARADSPYDRFEREFDEYLDTEADELIQKTFNKNFSF